MTVIKWNNGQSDFDEALYYQLLNEQYSKWAFELGPDGEDRNTLG